jgi:hypothetical protein
MWCVRFYSQQSRWNYFKQADSMLELIVCLPILFISEVDPRWYSYTFIIISRYMRMIMFTDMVSKYYEPGETDEDKQIANVLILLFLMFYISSGVFTQIEGADEVYLAYQAHIGDGNLPDDFDLDTIVCSLNFHTSVYFVIVTLLTIGYGDIYPASNRGMLVVIFLMIITVVLIPSSTSELLRLKALQSPYRSDSYGKAQSKHIVISGNI